MVGAAQEGLMLKSVLSELGHTVQVEIQSDAQAAISAAENCENFRFKHLAIRWLFLKELTERKESITTKVSSEANVSDLFTMSVDAVTLQRNLKGMACFAEASSEQS